MDISQNYKEKHYISVEDKDHLLQFLLTEYELDLREYSEASVRRRITKIISELNLANGEELIDFLRSREDGKQLFIQSFTVNVTEMFRDPEFYKTLTESVFPKLAKLDHIRIWSAGCSTGEELMSLAILLEESGLLEKTSLLGTDINPDVLEVASRGEYKVRHIKNYFKPYLYAGGKFGLEKYFTTKGDHVIFNPNLLSNATFEQVNLLGTLPEGHFDLICCRNVLIYFTGELQGRVLHCLSQKLNKKGFLGLGSKETLIFYRNRNTFQEIEVESRIYRKTK